MADFGKSQGIEKGTDAWNVAQGYTHLKILKPLVEMDKLVKIAIYGTENIEDSLQIPEQYKTQMKIEAIYRLIDILREIIENSEFAMTRQGTQDDLQALSDRISNVEGVIDGISTVRYDQRTQSQQIALNENHFLLCLEELRDIKKKLTKPLNDNSLIFPTSDEIDLDKLKERLIFGG